MQNVTCKLQIIVLVNQESTEQLMKHTVGGLHQIMKSYLLNKLTGKYSIKCKKRGSRSPSITCIQYVLNLTAIGGAALHADTVKASHLENKSFL